MAFDRTDPADLLAAKNYIVVTKGLDPVATPTAEILSHFNEVSLNPTPATGANPMTAISLINAAWQANVASQDQFKVQLLIESTNNKDEDLSEFRLQAIALGTQLGNAITADIRDLSWAEVNFGSPDANGVYESVFISNSDWFAARDS